jgi:HD-GYP domain-containing protein (c-di-GMP phosphodiesterase class II)
MAVLGIAIVFGVLVFLAEYNRVGSLVADRAQRSVALFNAQTQHLLERPGLLNAAEFQKTLEATAGQSRGQAIGRFVSVEITGAGTLRLAELRDPDYAHSDEVESYMQSPSQRVPQQDEDYYETIDIGGADHVYVVVPMRNSNGEVAAYARGVFALSEAAFAQIYRRIATVVGATIAVIIVTSLLLYPIIARLLSQVSLLSTRLLDANLEMIEVLGSAIAKRDSDTDVHNYRVTIYSVRLAEAIDLDRQSIRSLIKGAFLHDVGKIGISDNILLKPGRLDDQEFEIMKQHVQHGLDIVERSEWLADAAAIVGYHHTKFDGSGYHEAWAGEEIPLNARIFAIADVFDALTSERPYKKAFDFDKAMEILNEGSATHFDPALLKAFEGIAGALHRDYANRDDDRPRHDLAAIVDEYFKNEVELVAEMH